MTAEERAALSDDELIALLRKQVAMWFNNEVLLLFEHLVARYEGIRRCQERW